MLILENRNFGKIAECGCRRRSRKPLPLKFPAACDVASPPSSRASDVEVIYRPKIVFLRRTVKFFCVCGAPCGRNRKCFWLSVDAVICDM